jgi:hypothetical protein
MSKEQLLHIFEESACLTRRQMKDYVSGSMTNEESHAVELHLNACPFCNDAVDGMFAQQEGNTAEMIMGLDSDFLQDHLGRNNPRVHLNSVTATHAHSNAQKRKNKGNVTAFWRNTSIAAMLLLAIGLLWFLKFGRENSGNNLQLAQQPETQSTPVITDNIPPKKTLTTNTPATPVTVPSDAKTSTTATRPVERDAEDVAAVPSSPAAVSGNAAAQKQAANSDEREKKALADEVVVTQYKAPLVDKYAPPAKNIKPEQVEKLPTRSTNSLAATPPDAYTGDSKKDITKDITKAKTDAVSYSIEGVATRPAGSVTKDNLAKAEDLFNKAQYESALRVYSREFDSEDKASRQKAMVMAAQCHTKLGNTAKAKQLLESVIDEGGPEKRNARKLLKEMEKQ